MPGGCLVDKRLDSVGEVLVLELGKELRDDLIELLSLILAKSLRDTGTERRLQRTLGPGRYLLSSALRIGPGGEPGERRGSGVRSGVTGRRLPLRQHSH